MGIADGSPGRDARRRVPEEPTILRTAAVLFTSRGYRATSMDDLAAALDITKPSLYAYFRNKSAILEQIIDSFVTEADERLTAALDRTGEDWMPALIRSWVELAITMRPHMFAYLNLRNEVSAEADARYDSWSERVDARVRDAVRHDQSRGRVRDDIDPTIIAYQILALANWTTRWYREDGRLTLDEVVDGYLLTLHGGLSPSA
jgi:AcrR family transcriptional regulator